MPTTRARGLCAMKTTRIRIILADRAAIKIKCLRNHCCRQGNQALVKGKEECHWTTTRGFPRQKSIWRQAKVSAFCSSAPAKGNKKGESSAVSTLIPAKSDLSRRVYEHADAPFEMTWLTVLLRGWRITLRVDSPTADRRRKVCLGFLCKGESWNGPLAVP